MFFRFSISRLFTPEMQDLLASLGSPHSCLVVSVEEKQVTSGKAP